MNNKINCTCKLAATMRDFCLFPGFDYRKLVIVELDRGASVSKHQHKGHTVLMYPDNASPVIVNPTAGMMIYLPPGTPHEVPTVPPRTSYAMIID